MAKKRGKSRLNLPESTVRDAINALDALDRAILEASDQPGTLGLDVRPADRPTLQLIQRLRANLVERFPQ